MEVQFEELLEVINKTKYITKNILGPKRTSTKKKPADGIFTQKRKVVWLLQYEIKVLSVHYIVLTQFYYTTRTLSTN